MILLPRRAMQGIARRVNVLFPHNIHSCTHLPLATVRRDLLPRFVAVRFDFMRATFIDKHFTLDKNHINANSFTACTPPLQGLPAYTLQVLYKVEKIEILLCRGALGHSRKARCLLPL